MKEAYYFSHDCNARNDPKMTAMRAVYGSEGYGWYWMLIEMMRESEAYKLDIQSKYAFNAFALQLQADRTRIEEFINDCIEEFNLFQTDGAYLWSASLLRRMDKREQKSEARRKAAKARWDKEKQASGDDDENANGMQMHDDSNANAMQGKEKKGNRKESKGNEIKDIDTDDDISAQYARVVDFYQRNIGQLPPAQYEYVNDWLNTFDAEVLILAMKRAIDQGAGKWSYINRTLDAWQKEGAKTLDDCKALIVEFDRQKEERYGKSQAGAKRVRPGRDQTESSGESEFSFLDRQNRTGG